MITLINWVRCWRNGHTPRRVEIVMCSSCGTRRV